MKNVKMLSLRVERIIKFHSLLFMLFLLGHSRTIALCSIGICSIHFLALKLVAPRITCTPPGEDGNMI